MQCQTTDPLVYGDPLLQASVVVENVLRMDLALHAWTVGRKAEL